MKTSSGRTFAKLHLIVACLLSTYLAANLSAMPVYPGLLNKTQPDGTAIQIRMKGDEFAKWLTDDQGYAVVQDSATRTYYYAQKAADGKLEATSFEVGKANPAASGLKLGITPDLTEAKKAAAKSRSEGVNIFKTKAPGAGGVQTVRNLVILAVFNDQYDSKNKTVMSGYGRPRIEYDALFNWDVPNLGVDPYNAAIGGSVRDYWLYNSYGKLNLESIVVDWVKLPEVETYYTDYPNDPAETRYAEMVANALTRVEADNTLNIDFSTIDIVTVVHSGWGAEGGYDPGVHSHKASYLFPIWVSQDGVGFSSYNTIPALSGVGLGNNEIIRIGVSVHELGHHILGLPDLYDTDYTSGGVGNWCVMSGGSWGFVDPAYPSHLSAPLKVSVGFIDPIELNIEDVTNPDALRVGQQELDFADQLLEELDEIENVRDVATFLEIFSRREWLSGPFLGEYTTDVDLFAELRAMISDIVPVRPPEEEDPENPIIDTDIAEVDAMLKELDKYGLLDNGIIGLYDYIVGSIDYFNNLYSEVNLAEEFEDDPLGTQLLLATWLVTFDENVEWAGEYYDIYLQQYYEASIAEVAEGDPDPVEAVLDIWRASLEAYRDEVYAQVYDPENLVLPDPQTTLGWGAYDIGLTATDNTACYKIYLENDNLAVRTQVSNGADITTAYGVFGAVDEDWWVLSKDKSCLASSSINFGGGSSGSAFFTGGTRAGLPFESGFMLSTGDCNKAKGPNKSAVMSSDNGAGKNADTGLFEIIKPEGVDEGDYPYVTYNAASVEYTMEKENMVVSFDAVFASEEYEDYTWPDDGSPPVVYRDYYAIVIDDEYVWHGQIILDYDPGVIYAPFSGVANINTGDENEPNTPADMLNLDLDSTKNSFYMPLVFSRDKSGVSRLMTDYYLSQNDGGEDEIALPRKLPSNIASLPYVGFNNKKVRSATPYYRGTTVDPVNMESVENKGFNLEYEAFTERISLAFDMNALRDQFPDEWENFSSRESHTIRIVIADFDSKARHEAEYHDNGCYGDTAIFIEAGSMHHTMYQAIDNRMGEYLLIENRQPVRRFTDIANTELEPGFEVGMPYGGLAIWHIDEAAAVNTNEGYPGQTSSSGYEWPWNGNHLGVALLQADGNFDLEANVNGSDGYDLFRAPDPTAQPQSVEDPVLSDYSVLNDFTSPNTKKYLWGCVAPTYNSISKISPAGNHMSFVFMEDGVYNDDFNRPLSINKFADFASNDSGVWWPGEATYDSTEWWKYTETGQVKEFDSGEFPDGLPGGHPRRDPDFIPDKYQIYGSTEYADIEWIPNTYDPFRWVHGPSCSPVDPIGSPYDAYGDTGKTVDLYALWYEFTAEKTGFVTIETCTAGFDTTISVYRDPNHIIELEKYNNLDSELGCNDDYPTGVPECAYASYLDFYMEEGESYLIRIGGYNNESGTFRMTIEYVDTPVNDEPIDAIVLQEGISVEGRTVGATGEDISSGGGNDFCDLWYKFTPAEADYYKVKVCDGKADLTVGAYVDSVGDCNPSDFIEVTFNDNCEDDPFQTCLNCSIDFPEDERFNTYSGLDDPQISVWMVPEETYYIRVAGSHDSFGEFIVTLARRPEGDDCVRAITATDFNVLGLVYQGTTASSRPSLAADYPYVSAPASKAGLSGDYVIDLLDETTVKPNKKYVKDNPDRVRYSFAQANLYLVKKAMAVRNDFDFQLDLFADTTIICEQEKLIKKGDQRFTWTGKVQGLPYSLVVISVVNDSVTGSLINVDGKNYTISSIPDGLVIVEEVAPTSEPNPAVVYDVSGLDYTPLAETKAPLIENGEVCDVMVLYTPTAKNIVSGVDAMESMIESFITTANMVYDNSNINLELRLVYSGQVDYVEAEGGDYLGDLAFGGIDGVSDLRDAYGADLVCMLVDPSMTSYAGVAYLPSDYSLDFDYLGYSVVDANPGYGLTFTHELGHNMGCGHAVDQYMQQGPGVFEYSSGWYVDADSTCTVMSYPDKDGDGFGDYNRIPYFSNPDIDLGAGPIGDASTADNARTINLTRLAICNYRKPSGITGIEIFGHTNVEENGELELSCRAVFASGLVADITGGCEWELLEGSKGTMNGSTYLADALQVSTESETYFVRASYTYTDNLSSQTFTAEYAVTVVPQMLRSYCNASPGSDDMYDVYDVWYKYTPKYNDTVTISLRGTSWDTVLNVFDECNGSVIACNDDITYPYYNSASELTMSMEGGKRYLIRISGYGGATGPYTMKITGGEGDGVDILELLGGEEKYIIDGQTVDMKIIATGGEDPYQGWTVAAKRVAADKFNPLGESNYEKWIATAPLPGQGNLESDDAFYSYTLPFENGFPFFGNTYSDIRICTNGFIDLGGSATVMPDNSEALLAANTIIAPMWDDLTLEGFENNIELGVAEDHVVIKWMAKQVINDNPCAFAVQLFSNGEIQFHYGSSNLNTTPTVGISGGDGVNTILYAPYTSDTGINLNDVDSLRYFDVSFTATILPPGLGHTINADSVSISGSVDRSQAIIDLDEYPVRILVKDSGDPVRSVDKVITFKYVDSFSMDILEAMALNWLEVDCLADDNWCDQADLNGDGIVDINDVGVLSFGWVTNVAPAEE